MGGGEPLEDAMPAEIGDVRRTQCEAEGTSKGPAYAEAENSLEWQEAVCKARLVLRLVLGEGVFFIVECVRSFSDYSVSS